MPSCVGLGPTELIQLATTDPPNLSVTSFYKLRLFSQREQEAEEGRDSWDKVKPLLNHLYKQFRLGCSVEHFPFNSSELGRSPQGEPQRAEAQDRGWILG